MGFSRPLDSSTREGILAQGATLPGPRFSANKRGHRRSAPLFGLITLGVGIGLIAACGQRATTVAVTPPPSGVQSASAPAAGSATSGQPAKVMYQMDPRHLGRSAFAGPRQAALLRT